MRVGLVGCGYWGRNILRDLKVLGCEVDVAEPGGAYPIVGARTVVPGLEALDPGLDGYVVATPAPTHAAVITALAPRGKPIFCEKPLTTDAAVARSLADALDGQLFVMHKWAYHGGVQALAAVARSGELGPLQGVFTRRLQWGKPAAEADAVWELAIHDLSIHYAILGALPPVAAARAVMRGDQMEGIVATLGGSPFGHLEVSVGWPGTERKIRAIFRDGLAMLDDPLADHIALVRGAAPAGERHDPEGLERRPIDTEWPLIKELRVFVEHLRGGPPPPTDARSGAAVVEALQALREAALGVR
ncbi:Gfo/Idh/MocA family protein [Phenylobacterium sp.]|uniref:Gfo/Idh/MocA family protein n=1 Tax=Phenylobacterium sp. TaxID=1871053 RepID=UPI002723F592|nr:Gfo/Idh/MocA family oxidoreductase [Phenylobacterium sp.]MDO8800964.1 Gfo/Idh/MocA family oxidoreductase [Phenylobacterium sp.]